MVFAIHWHESAMDLFAFPIPIPPPTSLSTWSLWVFPVHQPWALVSCIQPGLVICFTLIITIQFYPSWLHKVNFFPHECPHPFSCSFILLFPILKQWVLLEDKFTFISLNKNTFSYLVLFVSPKQHYFLTIENCFPYYF